MIAIYVLVAILILSELLRPRPNIDEVSEQYDGEQMDEANPWRDQ